ncbi:MULTISPECIES: hypothetical protein [Ramlibacter]|uniref:Uncharacterized protein n=1 Tax=Ramlibacter pinisoli TaxID=2682844 RepID=A0A6N8ISZ9_9BURK|nr:MULTISPECIES: hypothetical protein [Ramlibacter]MBA2964993.1 hypothetical protein [Ramlibacter sp. CGMCC 1.13660]MVQ29958.1 hypothetical protein [Ramlibacter pinisoli]
MPIYRDRDRSAFGFGFDHVIPGAGRIRARKRLPKTRNQVLGHKDARSTQRFAQLAVDTLTAAVSKIGRRA